MQPVTWSAESQSTVTRRPGLPFRLRLAFACAAAACAASLAGPYALAAPRTLTVDRASSSCSDVRARDAVSASAPWCSLAPASTSAQPGDTVSVRPGTYTGFRPLVSGTPSAPIRFVASGPGVVLRPAPGSANAVLLVRVSRLTLDGFTVSGGSGQGVWIEDADHLDLIRLRVVDNSGAGIALLRGHDVTVWRSTLTRNGRAGVLEYAGSSANQFTRNTITGNGKDGNAYNGDGIQLAGSSTLVAHNLIRDNGDPGGHEHGVYAGSGARGYVIEHNTIDTGGGADVKAQGTGAVRYNRLGSALYGLVLSDNPGPVSVVGNVVAGLFQHAVLVTAGTTVGQGRLWQNTIVQQGRSTSAGNAAALFVIAAGSLDIRNNLVCYTSSDNLGATLFVNSASRVASLRSDANWLGSTDPAGLVAGWNGSRVTLAQWRARSGGDARSVSSRPPSFDASFHVTSTNLGLGLGLPLGVATDIDGVPFPAVAPDAGAYQHR